LPNNPFNPIPSIIYSIEIGIDIGAVKLNGGLTFAVCNHLWAPKKTITIIGKWVIMLPIIGLIKFSFGIISETILEKGTVP
jgi:hypothetical protein